MSTQPKFTPGPWVVNIDKQGGAWTYDIRTAAPHNPGGTLGKHIATVNPQMQARGENNASLIAAAPDLYAACEMVLVSAEDGGDMEDIDWNMLRAALAKARGEQPSPGTPPG